MRTARRTTTVAAVVIAVGSAGLTGCGDSAGPEAGATLEDLQRVEEQLGEAEQRLEALEEGLGEEGIGIATDAGLAGGVENVESGEPFTDPESAIGQEVTVSAEVSELITTTGTGSAFRIGGEGSDPGQSIAVIAADPPAGLDAGDVVQVSGTVVAVQRETFEEDFGLAADELFDDPDVLFETEEGQVAIAADQVEILQEAAAD